MDLNIFHLQLVSHVFEHNAMDLIFYYIDLSQNKDVRLAFDALKVKSVFMQSDFRHFPFPQNVIESREITCHFPLFSKKTFLQLLSRLYVQSFPMIVFNLRYSQPY